MRVGLRHATCVLVIGCGRFGFDPGADATRSDGGAPIGNRAFVTSTLQIPSSFGGLAGADAVCMARATAAGLEGRFVAYMSTTAVDARDRLAGARGWYRVDGAPLVDTVDDLIDGRMIMPLRIDERGTDLVPDATTYVTTGTYDGRANETCSDFTDSADVASAGLPQFTGGSFSHTNAVPCSMATRLYCFQIDYDLPVEYVRATGRRAFVSTALFSPSSGIASADAICATEAQSAAYAGTFAAVLPTSAPAASRFDDSGAPWVRPDGIALAPTAADFLAGRMQTALNVQTDGAYIEDYVETGGSEPTATANPGRTCDDWSNANAGNEIGVTTATDSNAFTQTTTDCMTPRRVYCLED